MGMKLVEKEKGYCTLFPEKVIYKLESDSIKGIKDGWKATVSVIDAIEKAGGKLSRNIQCDGEYAYEIDFSDIGYRWYESTKDLKKAVPELIKIDDYNAEMEFEFGNERVRVNPFMGGVYHVILIGKEPIVKKVSKIIKETLA